MSIYPIPTTRSSDFLAQARFLAQLHTDGLDLLRLQTQVSTGRRIQLPSEDPSAAFRAQGIKRLLELKTQAKVNLNTSQSYLDSTDTAISHVSDLITQVRSVALGAVGTPISDKERQSAVEEVNRALQQLVDASNHQFRDRYLFAGARVNQPPFAVRDDGLVEFLGNTESLSSFADTDLLFDANLSGDEVFGAISSEQQGRQDLNPILTENTRLRDLNGGTGIIPGSVSVSDGRSSSIVDLGSAQTIGDVARLLEAHPPSGRTLTARVTNQGLELSLDAAGGGNLQVLEVGAGTTAAELGIRSDKAIGTGPLVGTDLNPTLQKTTPLSDIIGLRAAGRLEAAGNNNNLVIEALNRGAALNGYKVQLVDDSLLHAAPGLLAGTETTSFSATAVAPRAALKFSGFNNNLLLTANTPGTDYNNVRIVIDDAGAIGNNATVSFDATNKVLHLGVDSTGATEVQTVISAIAADNHFTATYDASDATDGGYLATATISASDIGTITGNTGSSGATANTFLVNIQSGGSTTNQVVSALNANTSFSALFKASLDAKDTTTVNFAGQGTLSAGQSLTTGGGSGEEFDATSGIRIQNGGKTFNIDLSAAKTVEDALNILNGAGANLLAEISPDGKGINVRSTLSGADLTIGENGGRTATQLGLRSLTTDTALAKLNRGLGVTSINATDFTIHRNDGVDLAINASSAKTVGDVINLINNDPANQDPTTRVVARLAQYGNGIELVDDNPAPGETLRITSAFGSNVAQELGLLPKNVTTAAAIPAASASATLSFPAPHQANTSLQLTAATAGTGLNGVNVVFQNTLSGDLASATFNAGTNTLTIDIDATQTTANTVLGAINSQGTFTAALNATSDPTNNGTGIVGFTGTAGTTSGGTSEVFTGADVNPIEVNGTFSALLRLRQALQTNDNYGIERAVGMLDDGFSRVNFARADLGARSQALDQLRNRLDDEQTELKSNLSTELDVDMVEAISNLTARNAAYEASLKLAGSIFKTSLLDYL